MVQIRMPCDRHEADRVESLVAALESCLPRNVALSCGAVSSLSAGPIYPAEMRAVVHAVPSRQAAFRAGRVCARAALRQLGGPTCAIPMASDRQPLWPVGFVGAITHTREFCAAIVGRQSDFCGLGLDIEGDAPLCREAHEQVCRTDELAMLTDMTHHMQLDPYKLLFSIKEAVFKAYYPSTRWFIYFNDASVRIDPEAERFVARLTNPRALTIAGTNQVAGCYAHVAGHVAAVAAVFRAGC